MVYRYGIIPAHAGNTAPRYRRDHPRWDHPRACGEHQTGQPCTNVYLGSSPRMRGTLLGYVQEVAEHGIIPAHAGNTYRAAHPGVAKWDHPRACGEHGRVDIVHPHVAGSSPRMRGTPILLRLNSQRARIIPAHAGNTVVDFRCRLEPWDHPRACGEHTKGWTGTLVTWGSSPRMRGTRRSKCSVYRFEGIIPAHAGNTVTIPQWRGRRRDHPRACGEHVNATNRENTCQGSSPRMRGTLRTVPGVMVCAGIIPAHAGNTLSDSLMTPSASGSSPRMRGTLRSP